MCPEYITKILLVKSKHKLSDLTHLTFALTPKGSHQNKFQSKTKKQKNGIYSTKKITWSQVFLSTSSNSSRIYNKAPEITPTRQKIQLL
jgi:hypothetical protein